MRPAILNSAIATVYEYIELRSLVGLIAVMASD
jgi:hypothetical protein